MGKDRLGLLLVLVLACGLIAAGCGGDDEGDGGSEGSGEALDSLAQCEQNVEDSGLEGEAREQALDLCRSAEEALENLEDVGSPEDIDTEELEDDLKQLQEEAIESCKEIAEGIEDEGARELALESCENAAASGE